MKLASIAFGLGLSLIGCLPATATILTVDSQSGPWDPNVAGNLHYSDDVALSATSVAATAGQSFTITYLSGVTSAFAGAPPSVDALGYAGGLFGSGLDCGGSPCSGVGSSGNSLPSFAIDPTNTGPQIALNALIGDFVDATGLVIGTPFATGNGPFSITAPIGAVRLQLGFNDDIFSDNSGSLRISVASGVPEPSTWAMLLLGLAGLGFISRRRAAPIKAV